MNYIGTLFEEILDKTYQEFPYAHYYYGHTYLNLQIGRHNLYLEQNNDGSIYLVYNNVPYGNINPYRIMNYIDRIYAHIKYTSDIKPILRY